MNTVEEYDFYSSLRIYKLKKEYQNWANLNKWKEIRSIITYY